MLTVEELRADAETGAIDHYLRLVEATDGIDWVTQDMAIAALHDEERHLRLFEGYLREFTGSGFGRRSATG